MKRICAWLLLVIALSVLALPVLAQDDEENGGNNLNPDLQWRMGCSAWDRREYADAAVIYEAYGDQNPMEANVLEAYWRAYVTYHDYRPNPDRKTKLLNKGLEACARWEAKFKTADKNRAASAVWYRAQYLEHEGNRMMAITELQKGEKTYPGSTSEWNMTWYLGEWLREAKRYSEAVEYYKTFRNLNGPNQWGSHGITRIGWCYQEMGDKASAMQIWQDILKNDGYNWGWGEVHWNALDIARRLKGLGEGEEARRYLMKIVDKCDPNWDVTKQAKAELGEQPGRRLYVYPYMNFHYTTDRVNVDAQNKLDLVKEIPVLFRPTYITKDSPFKGTLTITPKVALTQVPDNMTKEDKDDKTTYSVNLVTPDKNGNFMGDTWFRFTQDKIKSPPPDNMRVLRKFVKAGKTWGECTITVQSSCRWHIWIWLPTVTNADNFSNKPHEVHDNGRLFRWYDWFPLEQGQSFVVKFPVEVGEAVTEYYPRMKLERSAWGWYQDKSENGKAVAYDTKELGIKLSSDAEFPCSYQFPGGVDVMIDEVSK